MNEKVFIAKAYMTCEFEIFNCESKEEAEKVAKYLAIDAVRCIGDSDIELESVEVEEA